MRHDQAGYQTFLSPCHLWLYHWWCLPRAFISRIKVYTLDILPVANVSPIQVPEKPRQPVVLVQIQPFISKLELMLRNLCAWQATVDYPEHTRLSLITKPCFRPELLERDGLRIGTLDIIYCLKSLQFAPPAQAAVHDKTDASFRLM